MYPSNPILPPFPQILVPQSQNQQGTAAGQWQDPNIATMAYQQGAADAMQQMQKVGSVGDLQVLGDMNLEQGGLMEGGGDSIGALVCPIWQA